MSLLERYTVYSWYREDWSVDLCWFILVTSTYSVTS